MFRPMCNFVSSMSCPSSAGSAVRRLPRTSSHWSAVRFPNSGGTTVSALRPRCSSMSAVSRPSSGGTSVSRLRLSWRTSKRSARSPSSLGTTVSWFLSRHSTSSRRQCPSSGGSCVSRFPPMSSSLRQVRRPISAGSPEMSLLARCSDSNASSRPNSGGNSPLSCLAERAMWITRPVLASSNVTPSHSVQSPESGHKSRSCGQHRRHTNRASRSADCLVISFFPGFVAAAAEAGLPLTAPAIAFSSGTFFDSGN
mmetsp:Transcript_21483/g.53132  ORF Transcript_21483/g.53132 Transcript_21483/m.53132 type:complete len:254 (+) Transcript_21483:971-1732(+)